MRDAFIKALEELLSKHEDIVVVTTDMGFSVFENIQKKFKKRFYNTGVTEQASMTIAAGMAIEGFRVFIYAQAPFMTMRCFEQVRLDVDYHNLNATIVGSAAGFASNQLGVSHFSLEDIALMRLLPNMKVFCPADAVEAYEITKKSYALSGPQYIRIMKSGGPIVHSGSIKKDLTEIIKLKNGSNCAILATGSVVALALDVAKALREKNLNPAVYSVPCVKPLDQKSLSLILKKTNKVFVIEEHYNVGGLGSAIGEFILSNNYQTKLVKLGVEQSYTSITGSYDYLLAHVGLSVDALTQKIIKNL